MPLFSRFFSKFHQEFFLIILPRYFRESFRKLISRSPADVRNFAVRSSPKRRGKSERPHLANHTANTQDETLMTAAEGEKLAAALPMGGEEMRGAGA